MSATPCKTLLIGYGNPGRCDDGLGPALAQRIEALNLPSVTTDEDYQLSVEHAWDIAQYDVVVFADACVDCHGAFYFRPLSAGDPLSFSTHSVSPQALLTLARDLFSSQAKAYVLGIAGYEFEKIDEGLTNNATINLEAAFKFISQRLSRHDFSPAEGCAAN